jgi:hypothetical protein
LTASSVSATASVALMSKKVLSVASSSTVLITKTVSKVLVALVSFSTVVQLIVKQISDTMPARLVGNAVGRVLGSGPSRALGSTVLALVHSVVGRITGQTTSRK